MRFEGVSFNEQAIKAMAKEDFVEAHKNVLWQDREPAVREKMLSDVYDTIAGTKDTPEEEDTSEQKDVNKAKAKK